MPTIAHHATLCHTMPKSRGTVSGTPCRGEGCKSIYFYPLGGIVSARGLGTPSHHATMPAQSTRQTDGRRARATGPGAEDGCQDRERRQERGVDNGRCDSFYKSVTPGNGGICDIVTDFVKVSQRGSSVDRLRATSPPSVLLLALPPAAPLVDSLPPSPRRSPADLSAVTRQQHGRPQDIVVRTPAQW